MASAAQTVGDYSVALPGQLVAVPPVNAVSPYAFSSAVQGVEYPAPQVPPTLGSALAITSVGGAPTSAARGQAAQVAAKHPWNPRVSAVIPVILLWLLAVWLLHRWFMRGEEFEPEDER
jgi:hypothetical protein